MKNVFSTTIFYGTESYEVTGVEYCEWEDKIGGLTDINAMAWVTYDFLMDKGYLVAEPKEPRPHSPPTTANMGTPVTALGANIGASREPVWSQSRILNERAKLLKEREKILDIRERALEKKIHNTVPQTDYVGIFITLGALLLVVIMCSKCYG